MIPYVVFKCTILLIIISMSGGLNGQEPTLQQIHILFRHGARTPSDTYPKDPNKNHQWPEGYGHLTNEGKKQMYQLGCNLKSYYQSFIPNYYFPNDVNFISSYADRCLMSAEVVAAGMFPPQNKQVWSHDLLWQPVPIHYMPRSLDNLIAMKSACAKYDQAFEEVTTSSEKIKTINTENAELYKYLTDQSGQNVSSIGELESLFYILDVQKENNLPLPEWVNETIFAKMKILSAQNLALYSETDYMKKMKGGFFLKTVFDLMQKHGKQKVPKINMYSGHDLTIVHVMRALNLVDTIKPEYGASVIFELYSDSTVKILYQDRWDTKPQEQVLEYCKEHCKLDNILVALQSMLPQNWETECLLT